MIPCLERDVLGAPVAVRAGPTGGTGKGGASPVLRFMHSATNSITQDFVPSEQTTQRAG
jgi:hypothetical protein